MEKIDLLISRLCIITDEKGRKRTYKFLESLDCLTQEKLREIKPDSRFSKDFSIVFEFWRTNAGIPNHWN